MDADTTRIISTSKTHRWSNYLSLLVDESRSRQSVMMLQNKKNCQFRKDLTLIVSHYMNKKKPVNERMTKSHCIIYP